jgi:hypothetical protein
MFGKKFFVKIENVVTCYLATQSNLSPRKARWKDFLA